MLGLNLLDLYTRKRKFKKNDRHMKKLLLIALLSGTTGILFSQTSFKESIKDYDDICFCSVGLEHPKDILDMDNNMEILFGLKNGRTLKELDRLSV